MKKSRRARLANRRAYMTVVLGSCSERFCIVYIDGPLLVPVNPDLLTKVSALLGRGERGIVPGLSMVSRIDAGGVGELVGASNIACAMNVLLRIVHATKGVRDILARARLFELLSADSDAA